MRSLLALCLLTLAPALRAQPEPNRLLLRYERLALARPIPGATWDRCVAAWAEGPGLEAWKRRLDRALAAENPRPGLPLVLALLHLREGDPEAAAAALAHPATATSPPWHRELVRAEIAERRGRPEEAAAALEAALAGGLPRAMHEGLRRRVVTLHERAGDPARALAALEAAGPGAAPQERVQLLIRLGRTKEALATLQRAVADAPPGIERDEAERRWMELLASLRREDALRRRLRSILAAPEAGAARHEDARRRARESFVRRGELHRFPDWLLNLPAEAQTPALRADALTVRLEVGLEQEARAALPPAERDPPPAAFLLPLARLAPERLLSLAEDRPLEGEVRAALDWLATNGAPGPRDRAQRMLAAQPTSELAAARNALAAGRPAEALERLAALPEGEGAREAAREVRWDALAATAPEALLAELSALAASPDPADARRAAAAIERRLGPAAARAVVEKRLQDELLVPLSRLELHEAALDLALAAGALDAARPHLEAVRRIATRLGEADRGAAPAVRLALAAKDLEGAIQRMRAQLEGKEGNEESALRFELSALLRESGDRDAAEAALLPLLEPALRDPALADRLIDLLAAPRHHMALQRLIAAALALEPERATAWQMRRLECALAARRPAPALAAARALSVRAPRAPQLPELLERLAGLEGAAEEAQALLEGLARGRVRDAEILRVRARVAARTGRPGLALDLLARALRTERDPEQAAELLATMARLASARGGRDLPRLDEAARRWLSTPALPAATSERAAVRALGLERTADALARRFPATAADLLTRARQLAQDAGSRGRLAVRELRLLPPGATGRHLAALGSLGPWQLRADDGPALRTALLEDRGGPLLIARLEGLVREHPNELRGFLDAARRTAWWRNSLGAVLEVGAGLAGGAPDSVRTATALKTFAGTATLPEAEAVLAWLPASPPPALAEAFDEYASAEVFERLQREVRSPYPLALDRARLLRALLGGPDREAIGRATEQLCSSLLRSAAAAEHPSVLEAFRVMGTRAPARAWPALFRLEKELTGRNPRPARAGRRLLAALYEGLRAAPEGSEGLPEFEPVLAQGPAGAPTALSRWALVAALRRDDARLDRIAARVTAEALPVPCPEELRPLARALRGTGRTAAASRLALALLPDLPPRRPGPLFEHPALGVLPPVTPARAAIVAEAVSWIRGASAAQLSPGTERDRKALLATLPLLLQEEPALRRNDEVARLAALLPADLPTARLPLVLDLLEAAGDRERLRLLLADLLALFPEDEEELRRILWVRSPDLAGRLRYGAVHLASALRRAELSAEVAGRLQPLATEGNPSAAAFLALLNGQAAEPALRELAPRLAMAERWRKGVEHHQIAADLEAAVAAGKLRLLPAEAVAGARVLRRRGPPPAALERSLPPRTPGIVWSLLAGDEVEEALQAWLNWARRELERPRAGAWSLRTAQEETLVVLPPHPRDRDLSLENALGRALVGLRQEARERLQDRLSRLDLARWPDAWALRIALAVLGEDLPAAEALLTSAPPHQAEFSAAVLVAALETSAAPARAWRVAQRAFVLRPHAFTGTVGRLLDGLRRHEIALDLGPDGLEASLLAYEKERLGSARRTVPAMAARRGARVQGPGAGSREEEVLRELEAEIRNFGTVAERARLGHLLARYHGRYSLAAETLAQVPAGELEALALDLIGVGRWPVASAPDLVALVREDGLLGALTRRLEALPTADAARLRTLLLAGARDALRAAEAEAPGERWLGREVALAVVAAALEGDAQDPAARIELLRAAAEGRRPWPRAGVEPLLGAALARALPPTPSVLDALRVAFPDLRTQTALAARAPREVGQRIAARAASRYLHGEGPSALGARLRHHLREPPRADWDPGRGVLSAARRQALTPPGALPGLRTLPSLRGTGLSWAFDAEAPLRSPQAEPPCLAWLSTWRRTEELPSLAAPAPGPVMVLEARPVHGGRWRALARGPAAPRGRIEAEASFPLPLFLRLRCETPQGEIVSGAWLAGGRVGGEDDPVWRLPGGWTTHLAATAVREAPGALGLRPHLSAALIARSAPPLRASGPAGCAVQWVGETELVASDDAWRHGSLRHALHRWPTTGLPARVQEVRLETPGASDRVLLPLRP